MSSPVSDNPFLNNTPKKKHHLLWLWITLIVIGAIVIVPVSLAMILFLDYSHNDTGIKEKKEINVVNKALVNMLDGCRDEAYPQLNLRINQQDLNQLLYNIVDDFKASSGSDYVHQFDIDIQENDYVFYVEVGVLGWIRTRASITFELDTKSEIEPGVNGFIFRVTNLKVGRIGGLKSIVPWSLDTFGVDFQKVLNDVGLSVVYDKDKLTLSYSYDDLINDLIKMSSEKTDTTFYQLFGTFFKRNFIEFSSRKGDYFGGDVDLNRFIGNDTYVNSHMSINEYIDVDGVSTFLLDAKAKQVKEMLDTGVINNQNTQTVGSLERGVTAMHQYLCFGCDFVEGSKVTFVQQIFSDQKVCDHYLGEGLTYYTYGDAIKSYVFGSTKKSILDELLISANDRAKEIRASLQGETPAETAQKIQNFKNDIDATGRLIVFDENNMLYVTDSDIHDNIKANRQIIGYGYSFVDKIEENNYKFNYAMLDNVYSTIVPERNGNPAEFALVYGLNLNGCETSLIMNSKQVTFPKQSEYEFGIRFSVEQGTMFYGKEEMPEVKDVLKGLISGVDGIGKEFSFDKNDKGELVSITLKIDLYDLLYDESMYPDFARFHKFMTDPVTSDIATTGMGCELAIEIVPCATELARRPFDGNGYFRVDVKYVR